MITINITQEQLQEAFDSSVSSLLKPGNYENPVKKVLDKLLGYSAMSDNNNPLAIEIKTFAENSFSSTKFQQQLGQAIADEMARRAVDALEKKK